MASFEENKDQITKVLLEDAFSKHLGFEIVEFEEKYIKAKIPIKEELKNNYKSFHGGVLYSIADILAGALACSGGKFCTTVEGSMNYLEPAIGKEYLTCEAKRVRAGGHLIVIKVKIKNDEGKLLDDGSFTFFRSNTDLISGDENQEKE